MSPSSKTVIAVDLGQTNLKGALVTGDGNHSGLLQTASYLHSKPDSLLDTISMMIQALIDQAHESNQSIVGIGISSTLDVDPVKGCLRVVNRDYFTQWQGFPIVQKLEDQFQLPVLIENDGIAAAWGEFKVGAGQSFQNLISITLGTGLGCGIILDGKCHRESLGAASYCGHMCIDMHGQWCPCGNRGCWELYVSGSALERRVKEALNEYDSPTLLTNHSSGKEIVTAAKNQDFLAIQLLEEMGEMLGLGLVNLANIFNPEVIVIGGGMAEAGDLILNPARRVFSSQRMLIREHIPIKLAHLGQASGVVGVGLLFFDRILKSFNQLRLTGGGRIE